MKISKLRWCAVALLLVAAGCKESDSATPIGKLLEDPSRHDRQTVTVAGKVGASIGVLGYGAYELSDDTGKIAIVSKSGGAPREGAEVMVRGEFRSAFTFGVTTAAAIIESQRADKP